MSQEKAPSTRKGREIYWGKKRLARTIREKKILELITEGKNVHEIAEAAGVSTSTVNRRRRSLRRSNGEN